MTDTQHLNIPPRVRAARRMDLLFGLERAKRIARHGPGAPEFQRTGPFELLIPDFPEKGQEMLVVPLLLGQGEIRVGPLMAQMFDKAWMYKDLGEAVAAACQWFLDREHLKEPQGWERYTGPEGVRRRQKSAE